jgi:hypothetical protein
VMTFISISTNNYSNSDNNASDDSNSDDSNSDDSNSDSNDSRDSNNGDDNDYDRNVVMIVTVMTLTIVMVMMTRVRPKPATTPSSSTHMIHTFHTHLHTPTPRSYIHTHRTVSITYLRVWCLSHMSSSESKPRHRPSMEFLPGCTSRGYEKATSRDTHRRATEVRPVSTWVVIGIGIFRVVILVSNGHSSDDSNDDSKGISGNDRKGSSVCSNNVLG